jgi:acetyl-CoA C-acetyltransferase
MKKYERIVKKFYEGLDEGKLLGRKCTRCGAIEFPPVIACNTCSCPDTEWMEMSGNAVMTSIVMPSVLANVPNLAEEHGPYCFATVKTEEGPELNVVVFGVTNKNRDLLRSKLPVPIRPRIIQNDGFKNLYYELVEK